MKLCLVFAPQSVPTSAPLGIATLKSFIERNSSSKVRNIDLNPAFFDNIIQIFINGQFDLHKEKNKNEKSRDLLKKAVEIFKGKNIEDFSNPLIYNPCANEFLYLFDQVFNRNNNLLFQYINNKNNLVAKSLTSFTDAICKEKPDFIGFSILTSEQIYFSLALAKKIKEEHKIPIIIGGGAVRLYPERYLTKYNFIDYILKGDGEYPLLHLIEGRDIKKIPNFIFKEEGKIITNKETNTPNLNELPCPDFSDFSLDNYYCSKKIISILTSRGCYWRKCAFCSDYDSIAMQYRLKSVERLVDEIKFLKSKYKTKYFFFADEMISPLRFEKISRALIQNNTDIFYYSQAKPTKEFNLELLNNIYKSGCKLLMWGVESGCQRILNLIDKGTKIEEVQEVIKNSHTAGIKNAVFAFGGFPTEKEEEYKQTLYFLDKNRKYIDVQFIGYFRIVKNSKVIKYPEKYGIIDIHEDDRSDCLMPFYHYKVKEGITEERSAELFKNNYRFFLELNKFSPFFGKFRDHMLVYYS